MRIPDESDHRSGVKGDESVEETAEVANLALKRVKLSHAWLTG